MCLFRVSASVFSVFFRVNPWLMLLLVLISVANASALLILFPLRWVGLLPFTAPFCLTKFYNILDASFVSVH